MSLIETVNIQCPYCWELIDVTIDCSAGDQDITEDCEVCCKPVRLLISCNDTLLPNVKAEREND
ncbi:MAG: CPXCG motif-containing cysteine-rich protein [Gammaproteobacteria bacterium]|nr:CPXCG motif-containing cysteine-rich protein [Gammaproteobacteria bacterium]